MITEQTVTADDIATLAYCLWEQRGKPEGRDVEFWLEAEQKLCRRMMMPAAEGKSRMDAAPAKSRAGRAKMCDPRGSRGAAGPTVINGKDQLHVK